MQGEGEGEQDWREGGDRLWVDAMVERLAGPLYKCGVRVAACATPTRMGSLSAPRHSTVGQNSR